MKKLIIIMAILLAGCVEKKERTEIGGNPDMIQHHVLPFSRSNGYTVYTFTFEQDGHKYMVATSYKGGIAMVEIKD
jgi:hypothetical protein